MEFLLVLLVLVLAVWLVIAPLRARRSDISSATRDQDSARAELEAQKQAKYREIREAELDLATGKLSQSDHRAIDATLRSEAVAILRRLDAVGPAAGEE